MTGSPAARPFSVAASALRIYLRMDGSQRGAAVAFHAFFSLFPSIVLLVAGSSLFLDYDLAVARVVGYAETFASLGPQLRRWVADTIGSLAEARAGAGAVSLALLLWMGSRAFAAMAEAVNLAWGERTAWWRDNLKGMLLFLITSLLVLGGLAAGSAAGLLRAWEPLGRLLTPALYKPFFVFLPWAVIFCGLLLLYKYAPSGRKRFGEVWVQALSATALLRAAEWLFASYIGNMAARSVYGVLGGIMALLLWVYVSSCVIIYGACLCAAAAGGVSRAGKGPSRT